MNPLKYHELGFAVKSFLSVSQKRLNRRRHVRQPIDVTLADGQLRGFFAIPSFLSVS
jgi:hypothetical protein